MTNNNKNNGTESENVVNVKFVLEDPHDLTDTDQVEWNVSAKIGDTILDIALENHINVEHSCGGVCACSTCHVYVENGMGNISEAEEDEEDRVEEAPGLQINSRLSCQCKILKPGDITVRVPAWNRNAVKEVPH